MYLEYSPKALQYYKEGRSDTDLLKDLGLKPLNPLLWHQFRRINTESIHIDVPQIYRDSGPVLQFALTAHFHVPIPEDTDYEEMNWEYSGPIELDKEFSSFESRFKISGTWKDTKLTSASMPIIVVVEMLRKHREPTSITKLELQEGCTMGEFLQLMLGYWKRYAVESEKYGRDWLLKDMEEYDWCDSPCVR